MACFALAVKVEYNYGKKDGGDIPAGREETLDDIDAFTTAIFVIEFFIRSIAFTLSGYLRSSWVAKVDSAAIWLSLVATCGLSRPRFEYFKLMRLVVALFPVRLIRRIKPLQRVYRSLQASLPALWNSLLLIVFVIFMFALVGMTVFGGLFHYCNDPDFDEGEDKDQCTGIRCLLLSKCVGRSLQDALDPQTLCLQSFSFITLTCVCALTHWCWLCAPLSRPLSYACVCRWRRYVGPGQARTRT